MGKDLLFCLIGIISSFLISLFFYRLGDYEKLLFVDLIANGKKGEKHDCVCLIKNIGRKPITMSDFASKDRPHFMTEETGSFQLTPPGKANMNAVSADRIKNDIYISFEYLKRGECIHLHIKDQYGDTGYRATQIEGKTIFYRNVKKRISLVIDITAVGVVICGFLLAKIQNIDRSGLLFICGLLIGVLAIFNFVRISLYKSRAVLANKYKDFRY